MTDSTYLHPTAIIDSDHPRIQERARSLTRGAANDPTAQAIALYYWVRDKIRYDPYTPFHKAEHYRASIIMKNGNGFCIPKASLLCALGRACHIPTRVGFATVRNHMATRQLIDMLGTDLFSWHGFVEFYLGNRWVKATPTFNIELCKKFNVQPLDFNGKDDSIFQQYNSDRQQFMEYVAFLGVFADIPVDDIVAGWKKTYGKKRVDQWIDAQERSGGNLGRNFIKEEPVE
ncbi:MAG: transglutaminase [Deltaproteobacteria bacterium]|nr:MAG: transglutaminase [Deltaproteobacteria bacterium]RTZ99090.1 MAG: transglutaminase [Deltaproteobacteria bacterium]